MCSVHVFGISAGNVLIRICGSSSLQNKEFDVRDASSVYEGAFGFLSTTQKTDFLPKKLYNVINDRTIVWANRNLGNAK